jgi:hypothetical protein
MVSENRSLNLNVIDSLTVTPLFIKISCTLIGVSNLTGESQLFVSKASH